MFNLLSTIKFCGGAIAEAGVSTVLSEAVKPVMSNLTGFKKASAVFGVSCLGGYLGSKAIEYFSESVDDVVNTARLLKAKNIEIIEDDGDVEIIEEGDEDD